MKKSCHFFLVLAFILCAVTYSKDFSVKTYTIRNGLSTNNIFAGVQDKNGRLWFATSDGVTVYDGYEWKNYTAQNTSFTSGFLKIALDSLGRKWLAPPTLNFPIVYNQNFQWTKLPPVLPIATEGPRVTAFTVLSASSGSIPAVGCSQGLYLYLNNRWICLSTKDGLNSNNIHSLLAVGNRIFIGTEKGLCIAEVRNDNAVSIQPGFKVPPDMIKAMCFENTGKKDGRIWFLNQKWIGYLENDKLNIAYRGPLLEYGTQVDYNFITPDHNGGVYFGNRYEKLRLNTADRKITRLDREQGFISDGATSGFVDREGNVWITDMRGIAKITFLLFRNFSKADGLLEDEVSSILEFAPGKFIFGHNYGFSIKSENHFQRVLISPNNRAPARLLDLCQDNNNTIWGAASNLGLIKISPNGSYANPVQEKQNLTLCVRWTPSYGLLVGTQKELKVFKQDQLCVFLKGRWKNSQIRKIFIVDDIIYCAGIHGLFKLCGDSLVQLFNASDGRTKNVFAVCKERGGLLVGTENGLFRLVNGKLSEFNANGFTIKEPVYFITNDGESNYWIGTGNGLYRWNESGSYYYYNTSDGLAGYEMNRSGGYFDSNHNLWIGTSTGLSLYIGKDKEKYFPAPLIDLTGFETNLQKVYSLNEPARLDYGENSLVFHFKAISFFNESAIQYRIKLDGYDTTWRIITQHQLEQVKYADLPPGEYHLLVSTRNHFTDWCTPVISSAIFINSPFYLSAWFIISVLLFLTGSCYVFSKYYIAKKYSQLLEGMVQHRTDELQQSEKTLKQTLDNLESLVHQRTIELAEANTKLSKEIEERKNFEIILSGSEIRFRKLINESWDMIVLTDHEGDIIFISASINKLLGFTEKEIIGQQWNKFIHPDDLNLDIDSFIECTETGKNVRTVVLRAYHKDGTVRWLEANLVNMLEDPSVEAIVAHCRDITEKKADEEELNNYSRQLEVLNTAKDKLFSIIAHDLRSPFTAILGYASILKIDSSHMSRDEINRCAANIETAAKNTLLLIESLLDWSRTQLGGIEFNPKMIDLNMVILEIFYLLHPDSLNKQIALKSEIPADTIVFADENLLKTIARNLIHNAIKFTRPGGQVSITSAHVDKFVQVSVRDTGIGIPPDVIDTIFELNSQASRRGTANERGTGLGLALCKEFIEKQGGTIRVESTVDKGTNFIFTLPGRSAETGIILSDN